MRLSVILPAYQAEAFLAASLRELEAFLAASGRASVEIIVVDDGSSDDTFRIAGSHPGVTALRLSRNRGKGAAVREGMLRARGDVRVFVDCDLPYELDAIEALVASIEAGADVCIGARDLPESRFERPAAPLRRLFSAVFTLIVSQLALRGFPDSQCGVKAFRGDVAERVFGQTRVEGFAFDVEVLHRSHKLGHRIEKVPVILRSNGPSTIRLLRDSLRMLVDVVGIPIRWHWDRLRRAAGVSS